MAQLLNKGINTIPFTNAVLRNQANIGDYVILRNDGVNYPDFAKLSVFKELVLELGKQLSAEFITDVGIIILKQGKSLILNETPNRIILNLENSSVYEHDDNRFTPDTGDLIWTNETLTLTNSSNNISILLVIDFREFLL